MLSWPSLGSLRCILFYITWFIQEHIKNKFDLRTLIFNGTFKRTKIVVYSKTLCINYASFICFFYNMGFAICLGHIGI